MTARIERGIIIEDPKAVRGISVLEVPLVVTLMGDDDVKAAQEFKGACEGGSVAVQIREIGGVWTLVVCGQRPLKPRMT